MADNDKFPLIMNGKEIWTMKDLRENYDQNKILEYYKNGLLTKWLYDRVYMDQIYAVRGLDNTAEDFNNELREIFIYNINDSDNYYVQQKRLAKLMKYTADAEIFVDIDRTAFTQNELLRLIDKGIKTIYLCGERFEIPLDEIGIEYIGVNNPVAVIQSDTIVDFSRMGVKFQNILFDSRYKILCEDYEKYAALKKQFRERMNAVKEGKAGSDLKKHKYSSSGFFSNKIYDEFADSIVKRFDAYAYVYEELSYDNDLVTSSKRNIVMSSNMIECGKRKFIV